MKYIQQVATDAEAVASSEYTIIYYVTGTEKTYVKKQASVDDKEENEPTEKTNIIEDDLNITQTDINTNLD